MYVRKSSKTTIHFYLSHKDMKTLCKNFSCSTNFKIQTKFELKKGKSKDLILMFNLEGNDDGSRITINGDIVMFYINKNTIGSFFNIVKNSIDNLSGLFTTQEWDSIEFLNEVIDVYIGPEFFVNECTEMVIA